VILRISCTTPSFDFTPPSMGSSGRLGIHSDMNSRRCCTASENRADRGHGGVRQRKIQLLARRLPGRMGRDFVDGDDLHSGVEYREDARQSRPLDDADRAPWLRAIAARACRPRFASDRRGGCLLRAQADLSRCPCDPRAACTSCFSTRTGGIDRAAPRGAGGALHAAHAHRKPVRCIGTPGARRRAT
jgi:hypothetical protein